MGIADKLKDLTTKAEDTAAKHKDKVHRAVLKAEDAADRQTGGQYHDQILEAGRKADAFVDGLAEPGTATPASAKPTSSKPPVAPTD